MKKVTDTLDNMYFQITTKCNMTCGHCCFSATHRGKEMSDEVFKAALKLTNAIDDPEFTLGGGEPTLHPRFWEFLGLTLQANALSYHDEWLPLVITNGSVTETAIALARLNARGTIQAELSQDAWHDPIDPKVIMEFKKHARMRTNHRIMSVGRGKRVAGNEAGCCCETLLVDPDGVLWSCGCKRVRYGTVFAPEIPDDARNEDGDWECGQVRLKRLKRKAA